MSIAELGAEGGLRMVAGVGWRPGVVGRLKLAGGIGSQSGFTLQTGGPVIVPDLRLEQRFRIVPEVLDHGAVAGLSVRIGGVEQSFGVMSAWSSRVGRFSREDANFLQAVANVLAGALGRLRVEAELRRSRDELAAIVSTVTDGILVRGRDGQLLYANEPAARLNRYPSREALVAAPPGESEARFAIFDEEGQPLVGDRLPSRRALHSGSQTPEQLVRVVWHESGEERWQILQATPLHSEDGGIDKVVVVIRDITEQRRETSNRQFLAEALATLSATLNRADAARQLAELCVARLADYCAVDLLAVDGSIALTAVAHADGRSAALAWELRERFPVQPGDATGPARVMREGETEFVPSLSHLPAAGAAELDGPISSMLELGLTSWLRVPLMARGGPIGSLTLGRSGPARLDEHGVALAQELGARVGIALENAHLFEAAQDRRSELDAVLAAMADAVLVFDASSRLRLTNRAAEQLFAGTPPRSVGRLHELVVQHGAERYAAGRSVERGPGKERQSDALAGLEGEVQLAGSNRWYELRRYRSRRTPADRGERHGPFVVVLRDITDTRAARAAREAFLGVLSHELRTPITTIYGGSELLERALDSEQRGEVVRDIRAESERLARLVEDLLVMTRVERGGVEIADEPVLMQRLIPTVLRSMEARYGGVNIEPRLEDNLPAVRGDATYLEQVLRNLLTNAVRYGDGLAKGIMLEAQAVGARVRVTVSDHGSGLGEDDPERLFDLFYRSAWAQSVPGGAGIGLFVCRRLVEAMGGSISARSRPQGGAEFSFELPVIETDVA